MNITKAQKMFSIEEEGSDKEESNEIRAVIDGGVYFVPKDPKNRFYREILKQVEEGTLTIADAD